MLGLRREHRISHGTAVQMAIKQAQVNNRAFLQSMAAAEAEAAPCTTGTTAGATASTGSHIYEVASNDAVLALRVGDRMMIVDHPDAKTSEFIQSVDLLMRNASGMASKAPPWELETAIGNTDARLKVHMAADKTVTMTYMKNANASPVQVDPIGRLDWKF